MIARSGKRERQNESRSLGQYSEALEKGGALSGTSGRADLWSAVLDEDIIRGVFIHGAVGGDSYPTYSI